MFEYKHLSWLQFDDCIKSISKSCSNLSLSGVYGFPRGGLCMSVALSHSLNIPLLDHPKSNSLIVDDIYETGLTFNKIKNLNNITAFVWFSKKDPLWWNSVEIVTSKQWVVFPWENISNAHDDRKIFLEKRNNIKKNNLY
tara:strand:- start:307 stop:726 length:420 start_codon:yes stop_codon:yes gene_type:complete